MAYRPAMAAAALGMAVALSLVGCGVNDPKAEPSSAAVDPDTGTETPAETEPAPEFDPAGTADDNLAYFDYVNAGFLESDPEPGGRPIVDNLVAAGFDRAAMEVTRDKTPIGRKVDSVQFSVRMGEACLVGQASDSGYVGIVGSVLTGSRCLIGELRPIDW